MSEGRETEGSSPITHRSPLAYLDCFSGISGDMLLGALVDAGVALEELQDRLSGLRVTGYEVKARPCTVNGLSGTRVDVVLDDSEHQPERRLADVLAIIESSSLTPSARDKAAAIFRRLAVAEARIHGMAVDDVHFHELGGVDSIVDIVGSVLALEALGIHKVYASSVPLPAGMGRASHGMQPLPAPATLEVLAAVGAPTRSAPGEAELVTPTGAAILAEVATFEQPPMRVLRVGYGFGSQRLPWPNALRLWLGEALSGELLADEVTVLETNIDDATPEVLGYAMERLLEEGALDVYFTPIQMKKNRPGTLLAVIAPPALVGSLAELLLAETTSLGVRLRHSTRLIAERGEATVETALGAVRVKVKRLGARTVVAPEYEDCARVARDRGVPIGDVYRLAVAAASGSAPES